MRYGGGVALVWRHTDIKGCRWGYGLFDGKTTHIPYLHFCRWDKPLKWLQMWHENTVFYCSIKLLQWIQTEKRGRLNRRCRWWYDDTWYLCTRVETIITPKIFSMLRYWSNSLPMKPLSSKSVPGCNIAFWGVIFLVVLETFFHFILFKVLNFVMLISHTTKTSEIRYIKDRTWTILKLKSN